MRHGYDGRFGVGRYWNMKSYRRPEDEDGLVGFQEVSHYWKITNKSLFLKVNKIYLKIF